MTEVVCLPGELVAGDLVDLEPLYAAFVPAADPNVEWWHYEYATVIGIEVESAKCVRVDHERGAFGVPAGFRLTVIRGAS